MSKQRFICLTVLKWCHFRYQRVAQLSSCCSPCRSLRTTPTFLLGTVVARGVWVVILAQHTVSSVCAVCQCQVILMEILVPLLSSRVVCGFCIKVKVSTSGSSCRKTAWRSRPLLSDFSQANHFYNCHDRKQLKGEVCHLQSNRKAFFCGNVIILNFCRKEKKERFISNCLSSKLYLMRSSQNIFSSKAAEATQTQTMKRARFRDELAFLLPGSSVSRETRRSGNSWLLWIHVNP